MGTTGGCIYLEEKIFKGWLDIERGNLIQWEKTLCSFAKRELGKALLKKKTNSGRVLPFISNSTAFKRNCPFPTDQKSVIRLAD